MISFFELLAVGVLLSCLFFLARRWARVVPRLRAPDLRGWPARDAVYILVFEIVLMVAFLGMNATDVRLQNAGVYPATGHLLLSSPLASFLPALPLNTLLFIERTCWWVHFIGILFFAYYITFSKHLHIFLAFPVVYQSSFTPSGVQAPLAQVQAEVNNLRGIPSPKPAPETPERLGVCDVEDLSQQTLLAAFACTECGRCSEACPAQASGMKLSPRRIMMAIRDRATDKQRKTSSKNTPKPTADQPLLGHYIDAEEINACTTCQACVHACPVLLNPMEAILSLRQYTAMETDKTPAAWQQMFGNLETSGAPWKFPAHERAKWRQKTI